MKQLKTPAAFPLIALLASLAGCGGGGGDNNAGSPTVFSVQPSTMTVTAATTANGGPPAGQCVAASAGQFFVYGGTAPYRLDNSAPGAMVLNTSTVSDRGGSFTVAFTGTCLTSATIIIVDKLDHQVLLTLNNNPAS